MGGSEWGKRILGEADAIAYSAGCGTPANPSITNPQCDEFPNVVMRSGHSRQNRWPQPQPAIGWVAGSENFKDGGSITAFYGRCGPRGSEMRDGDRFLVIPVPKVVGMFLGPKSPGIC